MLQATGNTKSKNWQTQKLCPLTIKATRAKTHILGSCNSLPFVIQFNHFSKIYYISCCCLVTKSCLTLCYPVDCSPPGSSVHGISQARVLEWVAIPFSKGSFQPRDQTLISCLVGRFFTTESPGKPITSLIRVKCKSSVKIKIKVAQKY